jgi:hypothetical protein
MIRIIFDFDPMTTASFAAGAGYSSTNFTAFRKAKQQVKDESYNNDTAAFDPLDEAKKTFEKAYGPQIKTIKAIGNIIDELNK